MDILQGNDISRISTVIEWCGICADTFFSVVGRVECQDCGWGLLIIGICGFIILCGAVKMIYFL